MQPLATAPNVEAALQQGGDARLFVLDACSLRTDLGRLAMKLRGHVPGSKFLALLAPEEASDEEVLRLFNCGIDGFVKLHRTWQSEVLLAIKSLASGQPWVPPEVLAAFIKQAKALLDAQLPRGHSLTGRELQVLRLLMRRLTNKEISSELGISERTVKFHVSNILSKLNLNDRRGLTSFSFCPNGSPVQA